MLCRVTTCCCITGSCGLHVWPGLVSTLYWETLVSSDHRWQRLSSSGCCQLSSTRGPAPLLLVLVNTTGYHPANIDGSPSLVLSISVSFSRHPRDNQIWNKAKLIWSCLFWCISLIAFQIWNEWIWMFMYFSSKLYLFVIFHITVLVQINYNRQNSKPTQ